MKNLPSIASCIEFVRKKRKLAERDSQQMAREGQWKTGASYAGDAAHYRAIEEYLERGASEEEAQA